MVTLFNHHCQLLQPYSAVETGMTFFSLPSFIVTFLPPSLDKPGTSAAAGGGRLNVYDAIKSRVVHSRIFRANGDSSPALRDPFGIVLGVCGLPPTRLILSSSYWPIQCTTAPISNPAVQLSAGPS